MSLLARERAAADAEEGRWLLAARRTAAHVHLGFGSFGEYVERLFGSTRRTVQEKRELTRVAVADTEQEWLDFARGKPLRQLEEFVAGKRPGDDPSAAGLPSAMRHVLRFEVAAETFAAFRDALTALRRRSKEAWDDDSALLAMAREVLGGPRDDGRASYQIALAVCPNCGSGQQQASGELVPIGSDIVAMAHCDGQHLGCIPSRAANENAMDTQAPIDVHVDDRHPSDAHVDARDPGSSVHVGADRRGENDARDPNDAHVDADLCAENDSARANTGSRVDGSAEDRHTTTCVGADIPLETVSTSVSVLTRAKQPIPPALRRSVLLRDQRRCRVPGCRNAAFLDVHHVELRSEGGRNALTNLVTVCGAHHRAVHRGKLVIVRDAHVGIRFRHADGTDYGQPLQPHALDIFEKLFSALRSLGFREGEVRAVLAELRQDDNLRDASIENLLREALRRIQLPNLRR